MSAAERTSDNRYLVKLGDSVTYGHTLSPTANGLLSDYRQFEQSLRLNSLPAVDPTIVQRQCKNNALFAKVKRNQKQFLSRGPEGARGFLGETLARRWGRIRAFPSSGDLLPRQHSDWRRAMTFWNTINGFDLWLLAGLLFCLYRWRSCAWAERFNADLRRELHWERRRTRRFAQALAKTRRERRRFRQTAQSLYACIRVNGGGLRALQSMLADVGDQQNRIEKLEDRIGRGVV